MRYGHAQTVGTQTSGLRRCSKNFSWLLLIASILCIPLLLNGCAGLAASTKKSSSSSASFQLNPANVNFGQVAIGKQSTQTVSLTNTGAVALNITRVTLSNSQFTLVGMKVPMAVAVGQSASFIIAVNATASGALTSTLTVQADGASSPVSINLSATALTAQAQLSVSPATMNFGTVSVGVKSTGNLVLSNAGASDLTVSMLTLTGSDFAVSGITTPKTISANQAVPITITFDPAAAGSSTGTLTITSSDSANPTMVVPLNGNGTSTATGQLSADQTSASFGTVAINGSAQKQIILTNTGNATVKISNINESGTGFTLSGLSTPVSLTPSQHATLTATFAPASAANFTGTITFVSDAANSPLQIGLTGTGAQAGLTISPASFDFGSVVDGQTKSQTVSVTNTGSVPLTLSQLSVNGAGYSVSGLATPATIAGGAKTTFNAVFAPTTAGSHAGSVSIQSNAPSSPNVLSLSGTGTAATVTLTTNPSSMTFSGVNAGSSSSKSVTITNSGNSAVTISQITVNAKDFKTTGIATPSTLAPGTNATMTVSFNPTASENISGNITVASTQGASAVIPVTGGAVQPALTVTPSTASFGNVTVGSPASQTIQLTNSGTGTLTISQVSAAGTGFSASAVSLPITLSAGQSTNFNAQFGPSSAGTDTGSISIVSNAPNSPAVVALSGTAIAATQVLGFSSTSLGFGSVNTGSSASQSVTVTNKGNASVTISQIAESGAGFTLSGAGTPVTLSAGQTLTFGVTFNPSATGSDAGTVTLASNATGSPTTISLSGTGVQIQHSVMLSWAASTSSVSGYNVYRSTSSGSGYGKISSGLVSALAYSDSTVQSGTTYYYVVTAVDSSGNESTDSNQATAVIP